MAYFSATVVFYDRCEPVKRNRRKLAVFWDFFRGTKSRSGVGVFGVRVKL